MSHVSISSDTAPIDWVQPHPLPRLMKVLIGLAALELLVYAIAWAKAPSIAAFVAPVPAIVMSIWLFRSGNDVMRALGRFGAGVALVLGLLGFAASFIARAPLAFLAGRAVEVAITGFWFWALGHRTVREWTRARSTP